MRVLEAITGQDRNGITGDWITDQLGMHNSSWTPRPWADPAIGVGFSTTARDLARFGLMIQAGGRWGDQVIVGDTEYLRDMLRPSDQDAYFGPSGRSKTVEVEGAFRRKWKGCYGDVALPFRHMWHALS